MTDSELRFHHDQYRNTQSRRGERIHPACRLFVAAFLLETSLGPNCVLRDGSGAGPSCDNIAVSRRKVLELFFFPFCKMIVNKTRKKKLLHRERQIEMLYKPCLPLT